MPALDSFTDGALKSRFTDTNVTNRDKIAEADIQTFLSYPVTGIGVGLSKNYRQQLLGFSAGAHTEYTRAMAEHGLLGIISYLLLLLALVQTFMHAPTDTKFLVIALVTSAFLTMAHSAIRLALVPFLVGFTFALSENYEAK